MRIVKESYSWSIFHWEWRAHFFSAPPLKNREQQNATAAQTKQDLFAAGLLLLDV